MALTLVKYEVTFYHVVSLERFLAELVVLRLLSLCVLLRVCATRRRALPPLAIAPGLISGMLGRLLKDFIVYPAALPW